LIRAFVSLELKLGQVIGHANHSCAEAHQH
jgi:hypothetical protein